MRDLVILFLHIILTLARLMGPGTSVLSSLSLFSSSNNSSIDRGTGHPICVLQIALCRTLFFIRPARLIRSAIVLKPSTSLRLAERYPQKAADQDPKGQAVNRLSLRKETQD